MASEVLLGALVGGGAALVGSVLTNIVVAWNLARQQRHDANQKSEDRKAIMRRDVYLQFVEDVHAVFEFLGDLQNKLISDDNVDAFHVFQKSSGKVWLIADKKNSLLSREFTNVLSEATFACIGQSVDVRLAFGHYEELRKRARAAREEALEADSAVTRANQELSSTADLHALVRDLIEKQGWESTTRQEFDAAFAEAAPIRAEYMKVMTDELRPANTLFVKLVSALREEIGLESDEEAFIAVLREQEKRAAKALQKLGLPRVETT